MEKIIKGFITLHYESCGEAFLLNVNTIQSVHGKTIYTSEMPDDGTQQPYYCCQESYEEIVRLIQESVNGKELIESTPTANATLKEAIRRFGEESQKRMAVEECAELINVLAKESRGRVTKEEIITEIADVSIMAAQLSIIYGVEATEKEIERKIARLDARLNVVK